MKGKAEPQRLYRVVSEQRGVRTRFEAGLARGMTELVGRHLELEALWGAFRKAKEGKGQVVDVLGEAGIGKSRLLYEFQKALGDDVRFLSGICIQYGRNINFLPVIDIVKGAFGVEDARTEEELGKRIEEKAAQNLAPMIPFYRSLLSLRVEDPMFKALEPEGRKLGTFEAVKNLLIALSQQKPLVVFVDDVHWMDKMSEELLAYFSRCMLTSRSSCLQPIVRRELQCGRKVRIIRGWDWRPSAPSLPCGLFETCLAGRRWSGSLKKRS